MALEGRTIEAFEAVGSEKKQATRARLAYNNEGT